MEIRNELMKVRSDIFVSRYIMDAVPFIFNDSFMEFIEWKHRIAEALKIDPRDIIITGSACLGVSLNPQKNFKKFDATSDIDIGIISPHYFDIAWHEIRNLDLTYLDPRCRTKINDHKNRLIFYGTIAMDQIWEKISFGMQWNDALTEIKLDYGDDAIGNREWHYRIYMDHKAFRDYQINSINKAKGQILENYDG